MPMLNFALQKLKPSEPIRYLFSVMVIFMSFGAFLLPLGSIAQQNEPEETEVESVVANSPSRYTFKVKLTELDDLKVKEGDEVSINQVIADRPQDRDRLLVEKQRLQLAIARLNTLEISRPLPPRTVPEVAGLPPVSYESHKANIAQATTKLELAKLAIANQKSLIEEISQLNEPLLVTHETAKLEALKVDQQTAQLELNKAVANLKDAQAQRQHQEYLSSLAIAERIERANANALAYQRQLQEFENQQRSRAYQLSDLNTKLADVEKQLSEVSTVRSPYAGTIRRIKWLDQSEGTINAEITLRLGDPDPVPNRE
ncbi:hypothetical protein AWQ21_14550 (plasmid) [Picosynechococcus sp. PCC 7003]|uniref:hypothetical protein n=1 Tax=Picosynechococcus sp. PCC 7003 TaxID=374981 RepID=UPI0008107A96|nr:hypothetical protein [Picosynechococcus sp. PCC 7003]ANV85751.1 hypothetical protein AWQ21_14550 [Picosynechococcus sp. PCC 7003]